MGNYFKSHLASYRQEAIGLVFFLTWLYCTLFGCGLVTESYVYWGLERIWTVAGLAEAVAAIVGLGLVGRIDKPRLRTLAILGTVCAIAGAFAIWLGYYDHDLFWTCRIIGGSLCGIAITSLILAWGARLCTYNEAQIEFAVPASFALAFALYCAILLLKTSSIAVLVIDGIFPLISMHYLLKGRDSDAPVEGHVGPTMKRTSLRDIASLLVLIAFLWFEIAYFRVISTPLELGDRYWHFLIPFSSSCLVALVLFLFCIKLSRYMNFTLVFRWALPLALVSYALLYMNFEDPTQRY